jgi:hypothetical protein
MEVNLDWCPDSHPDLDSRHAASRQRLVHGACQYSHDLTVRQPSEWFCGYAV